MTSSTALFVLGFLAVASAAPWPSNLPRCSTECPIAGSPKLDYAPEKTYVYAYSGKSRIQMKDVEGGNADMEWTSQVELTWLSRCDMAISIKNPSIGGGAGSPEAKLLEKYPLVVAMIDGRVQQACSHPDDDVWSVNMKKGIASAFQNSLPSNSSMNSGLNFTETDIIGNCSTRYEVENQGEKVIVTKMKNHRFCQDHIVSQTEIPKAWPKAPLPMEESISECKQEITKGIYTTVSCKDKNIIRPAYGSYKYIEAIQESELRFQSQTDQAPPSIARLQGRLVHKSLRYDQETLKKDPSLMAKLEEELKQVCEKTKQAVEETAASHVAKALHYLRRIPEEMVQQILQKIRGGQICSDHQKLEGLFLDAVAFIHEPGAVKVMVQELVSGRATGGRAALYTAALYFTPRPCIHSVEALKPLFENSQRFPRTTVAAASMVNTYCRQNPRCQEETPVRQLAQTLSNKVGQLCTPSEAEETRKEALVLLKALGNMGVMNSEIARPIIMCIEKEEAENSIRVAATQTFRNVHCHPEFQPITKQLVNIAVDPTKGTEARIGSYLAAMKCANHEDLKKITNKISVEQNTQVRGFILSHLLNIQESTTPYKEHLKYLITTIVLPSNFTADWRKYSRNIDLSYYAPTFGVGAGMESNVIYAPGSYVPRSVNLNLTAALGATPFNMGEIGARIEGLEPILEDLFGPEGYMRKTPTGQIVQDISSSMGDKVTKIMERLQGSFRQKRSIDFSSLSHLFDKLYGDRRSRMPKADFYARINDQEMAFASLAGDLRNINVDELITRFFDSVDDMISRAANVNLDSVRTAQIYVDYHLPTMQGVPLKIKLEGTAVAGLKMETRLSGSPNIIKFTPSLSSQVDGFIGFDSHIARVGVQMKNHLATTSGGSINVKATRSNGFELEVDLPEKMELLNMRSETYLVKALKGQQETKINPSSVRSTRVQKQSCMRALEPMLGLKLCYDINMPNVFQSEGLPLGPPASAKVFIEKSEPSMKGYRMRANVEGAEGKKEIKVEVEAPGSSTPRKANGIISYSRDQDMTKIMCTLESQTSGGIKVEIKKKWTQSEKRIELDTFASRSRQYSPDSKCIETKFMMTDDGQEIKVDTVLRTMDTLKRYIDINFEVSGDLMYSEMTGIPLPRRLRKFEMALASERWHVVSFVRQAGGSQYNSAFKFGQKGSEMVSVEATHTIEGSSYRDLTLQSDMKGKIGSTQYKTQFAIYCNDAKIGTKLQVAREGDSAKMMEVEMLLTPSGENYRLNFLLDIPAYIKAMKVDASATHQGSSQYQIGVGVKHGESVILHVEGPFTAKLSSRLTQLQTQLRISCMNGKPSTISTSVVLAPGKQSVAFELVNNPDRLMAVEWNMVTQNEQETRMDFKLILPSMIEKSINVIISEKVLHWSVNMLVMPKSSSPLRMKGFVDVDFVSKKAQVEFAWDADPPNKKVKAEVAMISGSSTLQNTVIHGGWTYLDSTCQFKTELRLADPRTWFNGRNSMKLDFTTSSHRTYKMETVLTIEQASSAPKVEAMITFKTPENRVYRLNSESSVEWLGGPYNMKLTTTADMTCPEGRQTKVVIEAKHHRTSSQREADMQIHITNPSLRQPVQTKLALVNQQGQYSCKWMIEMGSSVDGAGYELRMSPEGGVESFKVELKLKAVSELMKSIESLVSMPSRGTLERSEATYLFQYHKQTPTSHSMLIRSPSRTMEGAVKYSPNEYLVKFHPHKGVTDSKYELYAKHTPSEWNQHSRFEAHVSHPSIQRDLQVDAQYTRNEQRIAGSIELDIFPNPEDKITGKLESMILSKNTIIIDAQLTGKAMKVNPKVTVAAAHGPRTTGFDIKFHKTPSSPVSFLMSGKLDMSYGRVAATSFIVKTEGRTVMDITGSVQPHQTPECYGIRIGAKTHSSVIGTYDVSTKICKPAFIEVITKKHGSGRMYVTKLGVQGMKNVEISISEADPETEERQTLGMVRVKLSSPSLMKVETVYKGDHLRSIKSAVYENWSRLTSSAGSWLDDMCREVIREGGSSPPSAQMARLWQDIKAEASRLYEDLEYDCVIPSVEKIKQCARSDIVRNVASGYFKLWSHYVQIQHRMASSVSNAMRTIQSEFDDIAKIIIEAVMGSARSLQTGEMPEGIRSLWSQMRETAIFRTVQRELDSMLSQYPEEYQGLQQMVEKVKSTLANDFAKQRHNLMQHSKPRHMINWINNHLDFDRMMFKCMDRLVKNVVQNALFLSVQMEGNDVQVQLPIRRPVYSLPQAFSYASMSPVPAIDTALWSFEALMPTPVDNLIWAYYSFMPRHARYLVPPYNRTAMVVDGTEILTFDGAVLRAPRSSCKVLLAQHKSDSLVMQNQVPSQIPHFFLKASGVTVEVKPDFTVSMNGQPIRGPERIQGEVKIFKRAEEIEVMTPFMALRVYKMSHTASVEVSGWTFGQLAGLLGTYDGEMGNDWMTPSGSGASTLQELVRSWQEDQQCQTPSVSPASPLQTPVVHMVKCHALFGVRSRCNPVVRQEPFMKMCFASRNACHVARAYSAMCATKGVKEVFPLGC
uniref:Vitellogenin n=1 Tax=Pandalus japonicus TaxID=666362 RepID=D3J1K6_PANJP|nr:vitellogenin [Pandalus japonicus]